MLKTTQRLGCCPSVLSRRPEFTALAFTTVFNQYEFSN